MKSLIQIQRRAERIGARKTQTVKSQTNKRTAKARADSLQRRVKRRPWTHKQETEEMLRPSPFEREDYCGGCGMLRSQCDCWDSVNQL